MARFHRWERHPQRVNAVFRALLSAFPKGLQRLAEGQSKRPWWFIAAGVLVTALAMIWVVQLRLNSDFAALLPKDQPSVRDLEKNQARVRGLTTLTVALESKRSATLRRYTQALVGRLDKLQGRYGIVAVDGDVKAYRDFVRSHRHLFLDLKEMQQVADDLEGTITKAKLKANPFYIDLESSGRKSKSFEASLEELKARERQAQEDFDRRFPDGLYVHPDGDFAAIFIRSDLRGSNIKAADALIAVVRREFAALSPPSDLRLDFGGEVMNAREEHLALKGELMLATLLTVAGVYLLILLFFRSLRSLPLLSFGLVVPVALTFAYARFAIEYLNTSTAFLGSIVIGNGINPNIIWLARYFEYRRDGVAPEKALAQTHQGTWAATLTASSAAAIAYASLIVTDFRGFRDFGIIGGLGMVLCWLGAVLLLPPAALLFDRYRPLRAGGLRSFDRQMHTPFEWLVLRRPKTTLAVTAASALVSLALVGAALASDPLEYDFRKLRSERAADSPVARINHRVNQFMPNSAAGNAVAIFVDSRQEAQGLVQQLEARRKRGTPYGRVRSVEDFLPRDQDKKLPLLAQIRSSMLEIESHATPAQQEALRDYLPPADLRALDLDDLPFTVTRPFTEQDGSRGRIVLVEPKEGCSIWDGRCLVAWTASLRATKLPDGRDLELVGRVPIFADIIRAIWDDGPLAVIVSFAGTFLLVIFTFGRPLYRTAACASLLLGVLWMAGFMVLLRMKLNFLNFVAFPITLGNGADYGINVMKRFTQERSAGESVASAVERAVTESGGAVVLCSLTTVLGYLSLHVSANLAMKSFGGAMAISELTCLAAALFAMPALLMVRDRSALSQAESRSSLLATRV